MVVVLITSFYETGNKKRQDELKKCLYMNCINPCIQKIYLLNDKIYDLSFISLEEKIEQKIVLEKGEKMKYSSVLKFIDDNCKNSICVISNSDIYFDETLEQLNEKVLNNDTMFALLRYDEDNKGHKEIFRRHGEVRDDSQDAWILKTPLKNSIDYSMIDFRFGTLGCDNVFAYFMHTFGYEIKNPSYDIISTHVHNTQIRTYNVDDRIHGKYLLVKPCHLKDSTPPIEMIDY